MSFPHPPISTLRQAEGSSEPRSPSDYVDFLRHADPAEIAREVAAPRHLCMKTFRHGRRLVEIAYAPFDHLQGGARIAIVGLTPGWQQARNAIVEAARLLRAGASEAEAMEKAKVHASFSGPMRPNLVAMLDAIGVAELIGLASTATLWRADAHCAHFTSALRYPVFVDGKNYSGTPHPVRTPILEAQLRDTLAPEMAALPDTVFVPLGSAATDAVQHAARLAGIAPGRVLAGLPHPSGANAERIAFFLGRKPCAALSNKVNPDKLLAARARLETQIRNLGGRA